MNRFVIQGWRIKIPNRPFWRVYWNETPGAEVTCDGTTTELVPECVYVIPPDTDFRGHLKHPVKHLFVHLQLTESGDRPRPGIWSLPIDTVLEGLIANVGQGDCQRRLLHQAMLFSLCAIERLPDEAWIQGIDDTRIERVIETMKLNLQSTLTNDRLAEVACMVPTAFIRRFKQVIGETPRAYYTRLRLDHACNLLEYTDLSLEEIAAVSGFCDRHYLSAVLKKRREISPAHYRRATRQEF